MRRGGAVKIFYLFVILCMVVSLYGALKSLPAGVSVQGIIHKASAARFLSDLSFTRKGESVREQMIFNEMLRLVQDAEKFIVVDFFLFNDEYDRSGYFPPISQQFIDALLAKKNINPDLPIIVITDEINTFYGSKEPAFFSQLQQGGVEVIVTDMQAMPDSNPLYSGFWRLCLQWLGTAGKGRLPSPFSPDSEPVTLRAYLKLLNFKANHRKVIITEQEALVTSANVHDASGYHSNIGFVVKGNIINELLASERAVAEFSGQSLDVGDVPEQNEHGGYGAQLLTEGKIRRAILDALEKCDEKSQVWLAMFYLSDMEVINALLAAAERGADVRLVLDPNKDAFGHEKNGIPNRPMANYLHKKSKGRVKIRWYDTHGEQFHVKMLMVKSPQKAVVIGGSANFTRRNIADYNLESCLAISTLADDPLTKEVDFFFARIWENQDAHYTVEFEQYRDTSLWHAFVWRVQEWTGFCSY